MRLRDAVSVVVRSENENLLLFISYQPAVVPPLFREPSGTQEIPCGLVLIEDVAMSFRELPTFPPRSKGTSMILNIS